MFGQSDQRRRLSTYNYRAIYTGLLDIYKLVDKYTCKRKLIIADPESVMTVMTGNFLSIALEGFLMVLAAFSVHLNFTYMLSSRANLHLPYLHARHRNN